MSDLIEKLEGATEGSRELDCAIGIALGEWTPPKGATQDPARPDLWRRGGINHYQPHEPVTTSLDAALALVDRKLPGWEWHVLVDPSHHDGMGCSYAGLQPPNGTRATSVAIKGKRGAIALCIALLRALLSQEEGR